MNEREEQQRQDVVKADDFCSTFFCSMYFMGLAIHELGKFPREGWVVKLTLFQAGGHYGPDDRKHSGVSAGIGIGSPDFMTLFLLIPDRCQTSHF